MEVTLPEPVWGAIDRLEEAGFQAVAVGGCVRDALMGRPPGDYDVTTSAEPEDVKRALSGGRIVETGLKHGTVTLISGGMAIEITTFRVDGDYLDHRRPDEVRFTRSLSEDVKRRDFTVNALCYGREGLIDLVGGRADIQSRIIRCVGEPAARFEEDALRILRAARFSAQLSFCVDRDTARAATEKRALLRFVSGERIQVELIKLLAGPGALGTLMEFRDVMAAAFPALAALPPGEYERSCRAAAMLGGAGRRAAALVALFGGTPGWREAFSRLKLDADTRDRAAALIASRGASLPIDRPAVRRLAAVHGLEGAGDLIELNAALGGDDDAVGRARAALHAVAADGDAVSVRQLRVGGRDMETIGLRGPAVGATMKRLLNRVMDGELPNERGALLAAAREDAAWNG